jgi:predicted amidophosphoribosyltransferase
MVPLCPNCENEVALLDTYCGACGKKIGAKKEVEEKESTKLIVFFYVVYLLFAIISSAIYS